MASQNGNGHKSLVVVQLSGGNDAMNTVVPFNDGLYFDHRQTVRVDTDKVYPISDSLAFNPSMGPVKNLWDEGKVAVIAGIGYPNPNRSHFRSMDIWHTALPDDIGKEGWLGRATREIDPQGENVLTAVNFGRGLPRSPSVCAACPSPRSATWRPTACIPTCRTSSCASTPWRPSPRCTAEGRAGTP